MTLQELHHTLPFAARRTLDAEEVEHRRTDVFGAHPLGNLARSEPDATPDQEPIRQVVAGAMPGEWLTHATDPGGAERGDGGTVIPFHEQVGHVTQARTIVKLFNARDPPDCRSPCLGIL